ncbi:MAG: cupin domain-containing protein [Microbacteriaceae bacterium]
MTEPFSADDAIRAASDAPLPLVVTEEVLLGINAFASGELFPNHIHEHSEETFIGVSGELTLWVDRVPQLIRPGDVVTVMRNIEHCLRNDSEHPAVIAYYKAPNLPTDRVLIEWEPKKG